MANIRVYNVIADRVISLSDVDLDRLTSRDLIIQLIDGGFLVSESLLPHSSDDATTLYCLLGKNGDVLDSYDLSTLAELGYADGDIVRIIYRMCYFTMANITVKYVTTGQLIPLNNINFHQFTSRELIELLIDGELLIPESQLFQITDDTSIAYALFDKNGVDLKPDDPRNLFELGYVDGDVVRIYSRTLHKTNNIINIMADITVKNLITGEEISLSDVDLDQLTGRDLIEQLIGGGVLVPESQLPQAADGTPTVYYALLDKNGAKLKPADSRTLAELGYVDGDTIGIIQRGGGAR